MSDTESLVDRLRRSDPMPPCMMPDGGHACEYVAISHELRQQVADHIKAQTEVIAELSREKYAAEAKVDVMDAMIESKNELFDEVCNERDALKARVGELERLDAYDGEILKAQHARDHALNYVEHEKKISARLYGDLNVAQTELVNLKAAMPRWVSVETAEPDEGGRYPTVVDVWVPTFHPEDGEQNGGYRIPDAAYQDGFFHEAVYDAEGDFDHLDKIEVTHWRYPDPPPAVPGGPE